MWTWDQHLHYHLGTCQEGKILSPNLGLKSETLEVGLAVSVLLGMQIDSTRSGTLNRWIFFLSGYTMDRPLSLACKLEIKSL